MGRFVQRMFHHDGHNDMWDIYNKMFEHLGFFALRSSHYVLRDLMQLHRHIMILLFYVKMALHGITKH